MPPLARMVLAGGEMPEVAWVEYTMPELYNMGYSSTLRRLE